MDDTTSAAFSPNGRWLATSTAGLGGKLWEVGTWRAVRDFGLNWFAFSPDSRFLAVGERHGVVRLCEAETGREIARLTAPESIGHVPWLFSPDGAHLLTLHGENKGLYVWDLRRIREQLAVLGLDWDQPPYQPAAPRPPTPLRVKVVKE
jgi:WD40 repeat protein